MIKAKNFYKLKKNRLLKVPYQMKTLLKKRNMFKYYWFHRNYGYNIEDYRSLKEQNKELVYWEHLGQFVQKHQEPSLQL